MASNLVFYIALPLVAIAFCDLRIPKVLLRMVLPLILILCISVILSFVANDQDLRDYLKGSYYLLQPIILIFFGAVISQDTQFYRKFLSLSYSIFTIASIFSALNSMYLLVSGVDPLDIKYESYFYSSLPLVVMLLHYVLDESLKSNAVKRIALFSAILAIALSFSRTQFLVAGLFMVVAHQLNLGVRNRGKRTSGSLLIVLLVGLLVAFNVNLNDYIIKFSSSFAEIGFTGFDDVDPVGQYRAFEMVLLFLKLQTAELFELLFGFGLAGEVVLPVTVHDLMPAGMSIPILHNAFGTIYLKSGLVGILLFLWFITLVFLYFKQDHSPKHTLPFNLGLASVWVGIVIVISSLVTHGIYGNRVDPFPLILLGIIVGISRVNFKKVH
ncbi:hypothetical protein N9O84_02335 [Gammaproteobacteria bacterium]|nr:hypothetical protein [Gammaproteobacteria bacterium]